jgi:type II secretory pathway component PulK
MRRLADKTGAALLTVLIAMMVITLMLFEFQYSSMIERKLAYNDLNQMKAYYLAKAGVRMGLLRVALYGRLNASPDLQSLKQKGMDVSTYLDQVWSLPLPPFPPDTSKLDKALSGDKDAAEKMLQETKVSEGSVTHTITSESSKINLNFLQVPLNEQNNRIDLRATPTTLFQYVGMMLINVLDEFLLESDNPADEYNNMKPEDVVYSIMDYISPGTVSFMGGAKDTWYEQQKPPYKTKKGRLYTIEELRLVRNIDDHLYEKLRPLVTVYSYDGKINLNTATKPVYRALYRDFSDDDVKKIIEERDRRGGWLSEQAFIDYVTKDLNRTGFSTLYNKPSEYPFTVSSVSFIIESLGTITRSKSSIQKMIRVGVALVPPKGGQPTQETNPATCNGGSASTPTDQSPTYWDTRYNKCFTKPTSEGDCRNYLAGQWLEQPAGSGHFGCQIQQNAPLGAMMIYAPGAASTSTQQPGSSTATQRPPPPGAMKIMFWSES